jgi:hypothetical protein
VGGCWVLLVFVIVIGVTGILGVVFIGWISLYFLRFPLTKDSPTLEIINKAVSEDIPQILKNINTSIQEIGKKMERQNGKTITKTKRNNKV